MSNFSKVGLQRGSVNCSFFVEILILCLNSWIYLISILKAKFPSSLESCFARLSPFISAADLLALLKAWSCLIWIWSAPWFLFSWYSLLLWLSQVELVNFREVNIYFRISECILWHCSALSYSVIFDFHLSSYIYFIHGYVSFQIFRSFWSCVII